MSAKEIATEIIKKLTHSGYKAYFAGGWVRDYLMQHPSDDIDIATDAPPAVILDLFPHTLLVGLAFGVVIVVLKGHQFEVSTFRRDVEYINGRKPERIELSTAEEDALRRDFTINGMFYDPLEDKIYDYVQGMEDLEKGIIRTIGNPFERFSEDRLRMVRAIRFSARFGFPIEWETQQAIQENADTLFPAVAMERIWNEFVKMSKYPRFDHALVEMHRLGLLPVIFPQLQAMHLNTLKQTVSAFPFFSSETPTIGYLFHLFLHLDSEQLKEVCLHLRLSKQDTKLALFLHENTQGIAHESQGMTDVNWVYFYASPHSNLCLDLYAAHLENEEKSLFIQRHAERKQRLAMHIQRYKEKKPLIDATFLLKHGIQPGKHMGLLLKEAEEQAIRKDLQNPEEVLTLLKQSSLWP